MHRNGLTLKQKSKLKKSYISTETVNNIVPDTWTNFARLCKIRSGNKVVNFEPYDYQILLSNLIDSHYGTVIAKTRQLGITETIACKFLHKACLNPGYAAVILSKSQIDSSNIAKRIRRMIDSLSGYIEVSADSLTDLQIKNGGRLLFRNSTPNGTRGLESISDILLDEAAFTDDIERIYTSAVPSTEMVGDAARIILLSTPNGKNGFYWDRLTAGNPSDKDIETVCNLVKTRQVDPVQYWADENGWCKCILHWLAHPIYSNVSDYLEKVKNKKQLSNSSIQQEYNLSFTESEVNVFPADLVRSGAIGAYSSANRFSTYYMGVDTSTVGDDYTVAIILEYVDSTVSVVHLYRERKRTMDYHLSAISNLITQYAPVQVGIEITGGTGQIYLEQLSRTHYSSQLEGIRTTADSKTGMIDRVLLCLEKKRLFYPLDSPVVDELLSYRRSGKRLEAPSGKHDDTVMALAFAISVSPIRDVSAPNIWIVQDGAYLP